MNQSNQNDNNSQYTWDYLIPENNNRTAILLEILKPYLRSDKNVLEVNCGFAPLSKYLLGEINCKLTGFDINKQSIAYCQTNYSNENASFEVLDDKDFQSYTPNLDVLIHLGIAPGNHITESKTEPITSFKIIKQSSPNTIIIETSVKHQAGLQKLVRKINSMNQYQVAEDQVYTFKVTKNNFGNEKFTNALTRRIMVFTKIKKPEPVFSLTEKLLSRIFEKINPGAQATDKETLNLGFGFLYYSIARIIKPKTTFVFGSQQGFSLTCFALGIKDNKFGHLHFVDAGYDKEKVDNNTAMGGIGFWQEENKYKELFIELGIDKIVSVHVKKTQQFVEDVISENFQPDLIFIDADHSYRGFQFDFELYEKFLTKNGMILFHDCLVDNGHCGVNFGVKDYFEEKIQNSNKWESVRLPIWPGLGLARKKTDKVDYQNK